MLHLSIAGRLVGAALLLAGLGCSNASVQEDGGTSRDGSVSSDRDAPAVPRVDAPPDPRRCVVAADEDNAPPSCTDRASPGSFDPEIQWAVTFPGEPQSIVTPLVANMTDDNGDGLVNLCDVPDIVIVAAAVAGPEGGSAHIYLLSGDTGRIERTFAEPVSGTVTPALGDIDGNGDLEIVTAGPDGLLVAFRSNGTVLWRSSWRWDDYYAGAIALADLEGDGTVEIIAGSSVIDASGNLRWTAPSATASWSATTAADLDGDGSLEVVLGNSAYHADGTPYYTNSSIWAGFPQVADLDGDGLPEVLVTTAYGFSVLEHDGSTRYSNLRPTGDPATVTNWLRPATIHDFDGDGAPEFAQSSAGHYSVYEASGTILWSTPISDVSGIAAGTAFDFLGDGVAEAMYADENTMYIFGGTGEVLLSIPRASGTLTEYPVVADVDNDGSAEIVVVSNIFGDNTSPTVQVIRDRQDRWIQARRIWNEHTYHVTNVREDGTIPTHEAPSWQRLNTFRTNAQVANGAVCEPPIL